MHPRGFEPLHTNIFELESNPLDQLGQRCLYRCDINDSEVVVIKQSRWNTIIAIKRHTITPLFYHNKYTQINYYGKQKTITTTQYIIQLVSQQHHLLYNSNNKIYNN